MDGVLFIYLPMWRSMVELIIDLWNFWGRQTQSTWSTNQWTCPANTEQYMLEQNLWGVNCNKRSILAKGLKIYVSFQSIKNKCLLRISMKLVLICWGTFWVLFGLKFDSMDQVESVKTSKALKEIFLEFKDVSHDFIPDERLFGRPGGSALASWDPESLHRVIESFIVSYRNRTYRIIATEFAYWAPNIESMEVNSESNPLERKDAEGPSLDESLENEEHLDVDSCDSYSPKMLTMIRVAFYRVLRKIEDVRGLESGSCDSFEEARIVIISVLYNDGCIKGMHGKEFRKMMLVRFHGVHSHV
ncbi:hypothetical protein Tco_0825784 [Tanacetum coccineum]